MRRTSLAVALARGRGGDRLVLDRRRRRQLRRLVLVVILVVVLAGERVLELAHPLAQRAAHLGQALGPKEDQDEGEEDEELPGADPTRHSSRIPSASGSRQRASRIEPLERFAARLSGGPGVSRETRRLRVAPPGDRVLASMNSMALLELKNLHVALEDGTEIVKGVDLAVDTNQIHAVMGPNGSGKSTLAYAIAGQPAYEITEGQILLDGDDITEAGADVRSQKGLFLA